MAGTSMKKLKKMDNFKSGTNATAPPAQRPMVHIVIKRVALSSPSWIINFANPIPQISAVTAMLKMKI